MKNITILAIAFMGMTVSGCGDKTAKMQKTLNADCTRVLATVEDEDIPAGFCACFSEKAATTFEPGELSTMVAMFKNAKNLDDIENSYDDLDANLNLKEKMGTITDACGV